MSGLCSSASGSNHGGSSLILVVRGVEKCSPICSSPTTTTMYVFSGSKVVTEYSENLWPGAPTREYLYAGSQLLATLEGTTARYHHADQLSVRATTNSSGTVVSTQGHFPFGEQWYATGPETSKWKFTSYERDAESGNDYAIFRTHINRLGRFNSPDPIAGSTADPQSLNRYAYVRNNPLNMVDPLGLEFVPCMINGQFSFCGTVTEVHSASVTISLKGSRDSGPPRYARSGSLNGGGGSSDDFELVLDFGSDQIPGGGGLVGPSGIAGTPPPPPGRCAGFVPPVGNAPVSSPYGSQDIDPNSPTRRR